MNCCSNCFKDLEIRSFIIYNSSTVGTCDYCETIETQLIDPTELEEPFLYLINIYKPVSSIKLFVNDIPLRIDQKIQKDWSIFKIKSAAVRFRLMHDIVSNSFPSVSQLFMEPVVNEFFSKLGTNIHLHEQSWETFGLEIKNSNRFFLKEKIDLILLADLLPIFLKVYSKNKVFYRARISGKEGIIPSEMGKPPSEKAKAGRANPRGIPYLYVSTDVNTTKYESRSAYRDFITVGKFVLKDTIEVISLVGTQNLRPFDLNQQAGAYLVYKKYIAKLEHELSKPLRGFDNELDYLPTQYLCEYIKSLGYDAIEYGSSINSKGINLAIFNDDLKIECQSVEVYEIDKIRLHANKI